MTQLTDELFAVEVPEDATDTELHVGYITYHVGIGTDNFDILRQSDSGITGDSELIGTVSHDAIDFDCGLYINPDKLSLSKKVLEKAFRSLMKYKGLDNSKKYVIIKKEK